jgi:hypothetical protein
MTKNTRRIISFIVPWLLINGICWLLIPFLHVSAVYFTKSFSVLSGLMMSALYFAGIKEAQHQRRTLNITLAVIGIKMLGSVAIFLRYFMQNKVEPVLPLITGASIYLVYTLLIVGYAYYWTLKAK